MCVAGADKDGRQQVLLQKRSEEKDLIRAVMTFAQDIFGGCGLCVSIMELKEELGVKYGRRSAYCGQRKFHFEEIDGERFKDNQISNVYSWMDREAEEFQIQKEELARCAGLTLKSA